MDEVVRIAPLFRQGLKETDFIEGENVTIEYRWAEGQYDRLIVLARNLVLLGLSGRGR